MKEEVAKTSLAKVLQILWPTLRPHRSAFLLGVVLILTSTGIEIVLPIVVGRAVDVVAGSNPFPVLLRLSLVFLGLILAKFAIDTIQAYVIQSSGQRISHALRCLLFAKIQRLPVAYFDANPSGRLLTRVVNDIKSLSELFTASMSVLALDVLIIIGTVITMFALDAKLAAVVLATFPLVVWSIHHFGKQLASAYRQVRLRLSEINAFLGENISAIATIQRLGAEKERLETFETIGKAHESAQMQSLRVFATVQPIANVVNGVATASLLIAGGYWVIQNRISIGIIVTFLGYTRNIFQPIRDLVEKYNVFLSSMVAAERVVTILEEAPEEEIRSVLETSPLDLAKYDVIFDNVSFRYPNRSEWALKNVSFSVRAGTSIAVVGPTGSGKSTLIRLLLRFYNPTEGSIQLGASSLESWSRQELRKHIGVVHQDIYLFKGTLRENLTLGRTGFSDSYLIQQAERAQLWDLISQRGGLQMQLQEGGANLSLGERQLLSFARILVFDTPLLILDEATSHLDRLTEIRLMRAVEETLRGRTCIVIAHRLATIRKCQEVIVLERGSKTQQGSYDQLTREEGLFKRFHELS